MIITHSLVFTSNIPQILRTVLKPVGGESRQVLEVNYTVTVVVFTYREARIRSEVVIFRLAEFPSVLRPGTTVASEAGRTAAGPGLRGKSNPHPYLFGTCIRMPGKK